MQIFFRLYFIFVFISIFFAPKARLQELKSEFCQIRTNLQYVDKISLKLDSSLSLLLEYDRSALKYIVSPFHLQCSSPSN